MREGPGQAALVVARSETFTLPEISAFVLRQARTMAEKALGEQVERAVVTVPANFNDLQRAATKVAGRVAGLEVLRILNEPTAAALAYGYGKSKGERIAIYDFGGGTFDVTLLDLSGNVFEVLATAGNTFLGGDDIDIALAEEMATACKAEHGIDATADLQIFERLRYYAERLKMELSTSDQALVDVPDVGAGPSGKPLRLTFPMSRSRLDEVASPIIERTFDVCREALSIARLSPGAFDQIVLVGGSTRLPLVRERVEGFFGKRPLDRINPDEVVAIGAAIQASALSGTDRRKSVIPRAPMPAALGRKSQPPPHPKARTTNPMVVGPRAEQHPPSQPPARRRVTTGVGLGPARQAAGLKPPTGSGTAGGHGAPPAAAARGGTLGGVGTPESPLRRPRPLAAPPLPRKLERSSDLDGLWAGEGTAEKPVASDEGEVPTRVSWDLPAGGAAPSPPAAPLTKVDADDVPTHVGPLDDLLAMDPGDLDRPFGAPSPTDDASPRGEPTLADEDDRKNRIEAADLGFDEAPPEPVHRAPPAPTREVEPSPRQPPARSLARTQLGVAPPPVRERAPSAPDLAPRAPPPLDFSAIGGQGGAPRHESGEERAAARARELGSLLDAPGEFAPAQPHAHRLDMPEPTVSRPPLPLLVDVTPLSLSVETVGGYRDVVIPRNSPVPCEQARTFVTAQHGQTTVHVRVGQGESERFSGDTLLGAVELSGLRAAARGEVHIVVTFALDTDGMLEVRARDAETGHSALAHLRLVGLPDAADVARMTERHTQRGG
jgi:molecular chaperone DnaK